MQQSRMLARLTDETGVQHPGTDAELDVLFGSDLSSPHYLMFLIRCYGFEAPLESALKQTSGLERILDLRERTKAGLIAADLLELGVRPAEIAELPQCLAIPLSFRGVPEALGWMYVAERTTLAFGVIRHHLETRLPKDVMSAASYLGCYEGIVGARWRLFGEVLDEQAVLPGVEDRIIAAAGDGLRCQRSWIKQDPRVPIESAAVVQTRRAQ
jgi:heme oxygenase